MVEKLLQSNAWFAVALAVVSYTAGYWLALYEAYLYHSGAKNFIALEGIYEWSPVLQGPVTRRQIINLKLVTVLVVVGLCIFILWQVFVKNNGRPEVFSILMGGLVLLEIAAGMQRLRNIVLFHNARRMGNLHGKIEYSKRLVNTLWFAELYSFAALYLVVFLVTSSWFFLGGALVCFVSGHRRRDWTVVYT